LNIYIYIYIFKFQLFFYVLLAIISCYFTLHIFYRENYILLYFSHFFFNTLVISWHISCFHLLKRIFRKIRKFLPFFLLFFLISFSYLFSLLSLPPLSLHRRPRDGVSLAPTARAVDRSSWQPSDESTVAQGGWTAGWRAWTDGAEVSARADAKLYVCVVRSTICHCLSFSLSLSPALRIVPHSIAHVLMVFVFCIQPNQTPGGDALETEVNRWQWHYGVIQLTSYQVRL